ncbi:MAG TPA: ATP-binding protein, partial [Herpetosiphonaceae bacterium]
PAEPRAGLATRRSYIQLDVTDTGIGIAPEDQEHIFERFYRVESDLKVEAGGTGLGLAIVRPLISLMGGRLWLESELEKGSTFTLILPVAA